MARFVVTVWCSERFPVMAYHNREYVPYLVIHPRLRVSDTVGPAGQVLTPAYFFHYPGDTAYTSEMLRGACFGTYEKQPPEQRICPQLLLSSLAPDLHFPHRHTGYMMVIRRDSDAKSNLRTAKTGLKFQKEGKAGHHGIVLCSNCRSKGE